MKLSNTHTHTLRIISISSSTRTINPSNSTSNTSTISFTKDRKQSTSHSNMQGSIIISVVFDADGTFREDQSEDVVLSSVFMNDMSVQICTFLNLDSPRKFL